jgi:hypothetical protein
VLLSALALERPSRQKRRLGHCHRIYGMRLSDQDSPALLLGVAQGYQKPCHWSHCCLVVPGEPDPFSQHYSFDTRELARHPANDSSLQCVDSEFMLQLALRQGCRILAARGSAFCTLPFQPIVLSTADLSLMRLNCDCPQLERLLALCGRHYLLYRELLEIGNLPMLTISS